MKRGLPTAKCRRIVLSDVAQSDHRQIRVPVEEGPEANVAAPEEPELLTADGADGSWGAEANVH